MTRTLAEAIAGQNAPVVQSCNSLGRLLVDLSSHQCRFPLRGEGAAMRFCAVEIGPDEWQPGRSGGSYCRHHRLVTTGRGTESERTAHRVLEKAER
jgi:hypothetical protein